MKSFRAKVIEVHLLFPPQINALKIYLSNSAYRWLFDLLVLGFCLGTAEDD